MITGLYAAIFALIQIKFTLNVAMRRKGAKISLGDGGDDTLNRKIRAHGNFVETVPMALFLMGIAELSGAPFWSIHVLGGLMLIGRILHYSAIVTGTGYGKNRMYGMMLTFLVYVLGAGLCLWLSVPLLIPAA
jgi:hypothetical protein